MNVEYAIKFKGQLKSDFEAYIEKRIQETNKEYVINKLKNDIINAFKIDFNCANNFIDYDLDAEVKIIENNE